MARFRWFFAVALAVSLALAPALAEARAGGGKSMGSRGARTYHPNEAQPMQRSVQPPATAPSQAARPAPGMASPMGQPSFFQRHPFLTGLFGGFLGAGLFGMLLGNPAWAADGSGLGSSMGFLLQILLIAGLAWLAFRIWRSRSAAGPGVRPMARGYEPAYAGAVPAGAAANPVEVAITPADYESWGALLAGIQDAWSRGDLGALRRFVTPEMLGYFSDELSALASRGLENKVEQVELLKGDVEETWAEAEMEYATARLRWRALDHTSRIGTGEVVEGSRSAPTEATEVWTFARARGGSWLLSAIQQS
jgi:predicted lipid-binding transport protein (Tim44 family)